MSHDLWQSGTLTLLVTFVALHLGRGLFGTNMSVGRETVIWDAVVVGAGVEGSATAYHLAKNNQRTLLLEQFGLPHTRGSSHGQSRIIRYGYDQDYYTAMMPDAFEQWHDIEKQTGVTLIKDTGLVSVDCSPYVEYNKKRNVLTRAGIGFKEFTGQEAKKKYPFLNYGPDYKFLLEEKSGLIRADKAVLCLQNLFKRNGGVIQDEEKLLDVLPGPVVTIKTNKGTHRAKNVILTVGPWASQVLSPLGLQLPLKPLRIRVCYWKEKSPGTCSQFPGFIAVGGVKSGHDIYGLQVLEYPNMMKICHHYGEEIDPDDRDKESNYRVDLDALEKYVSDHFPCLENKPSIVEACIYTVTPDEDFVLDRHPHFKNIIIGAGFQDMDSSLLQLLVKSCLNLLWIRSHPMTFHPLQ
ncbi:peroxisomal sarcosine oxidase-like isoform X1 [Ptychodera flava]|uniref:peroxisomal sarcosine oxidase-like isoform X1 n=1 Tax=Ptychodera flava TaxID=63121 RepID=UPI00396A4EB4